RVGRGEDQVGAEHLRVVDLLDVRRTRLVPGGLGRTRRAGAAALLGLVPTEIEQRQSIRLDRLNIDLGAVVLELRIVPAAARGRRLDVGAAEAAPQPDVVPPRRTAHLDTVVLHVVNAVGAGDAPVPRLLR